MPDEIYTTTMKDFERYKKETKYWVEKLGLTDREIYVEHDQTDEDARAVAVSDLEAKMSRTILQKNWGEIPEQNEIERVAFHEVMEIVLAELWILANRRFISGDALEMSRHGIIRRLEHCLWKPDFNKRKKKK